MTNVKKLAPVFVVTAAAGLGGCAAAVPALMMAAQNPQIMAQVTGGILGGMIGAKVTDNSTAGTVAGTLLGIPVGGAVLDMLTRQGGGGAAGGGQTDEKMVADATQNALDQHRKGVTVMWNNASTGSRGDVTVTRVRKNGCEDVRQTAVIGGQKQSYTGTACPTGNGGWAFKPR